MSAQVEVGGRNVHRGGGFSARTNHQQTNLRRNNYGSHRGRGVRQLPGQDRGGVTRFFGFRRPTTILTDSRPSQTHSVSVIDRSSSRKAGMIALLIIGVAMMILGGALFPVNPVAGFVVGGVGAIATVSAISSFPYR